MTKAAAALNVAQPALGLQIRQLEEFLGTILLERHSRGVSVTPAGQLLYDRAVRILALFERAEADVRALGGTHQEVLRLGVTHSTMRLVGSELLVAARRDIPDVLFSVVEEPSPNLMRELENGGIDLALTYEVSSASAIERAPLLVEELVFVARADKVTPRETISLKEALDHELVLASDRDPIRRMVEATAREAGLSVKIGYEVQSLLGTRQVVLDGLAATILPYGALVQDIREGVMTSMRLTGTPLRRTLYLAQRSRRQIYASEKRIQRLIRSVVKQLMLDLGPLAEAPPPSADPQS